MPGRHAHPVVEDRRIADVAQQVPTSPLVEAPQDAFPTRRSLREAAARQAQAQLAQAPATVLEAVVPTSPVVASQPARVAPVTPPAPMSPIDAEPIATEPIATEPIADGQPAPAPVAEEQRRIRPAAARALHHHHGAARRSTYVHPHHFRPALPPAKPVEPKREVKRFTNVKRLAHVVAPLLAITSGLAVALPANAATPEAKSVSITSAAQDYTVSKGFTVPITTSNGRATVVSFPTLVVGLGASPTTARAAVVDALTDGGDRAKIISTALEYLGDPYVEGGASHSGIDCSGLVMVAYQSVGINLVHYVPTQDAAATTIPESEAQPGDLVVYNDEEHIGIYMGDGLVLQAPHPGEPVDIIPMFSAPHHFARVLPAGS
jgi:peptidoglycan DL-endopeptidase RipA